MHFGWKVLIPISLVWIMAVTAIHVLRDRGWPAWKATGVPLAVTLLLVVVPALMLWDAHVARTAEREADDDRAEAELSPAFPIPPRDLVVPAPMRMATASVSPTPAGPARQSELPEGDGDG